MSNEPLDIIRKEADCSWGSGFGLENKVDSTKRGCSRNNVKHSESLGGEEVAKK